MTTDKLIIPSKKRTKCLLLPAIDNSHNDRLASAFLIRLDDNLINRIKTSKILFGMGSGRIEGLELLQIRLSQKDFKKGTVQVLKTDIDDMEEIYDVAFSEYGYCFIEEVSREKIEGYHLGISDIIIRIYSNSISFICSYDQNEEIWTDHIQDKHNLFYEPK